VKQALLLQSAPRDFGSTKQGKESAMENVEQRVKKIVAEQLG